MSVLISSSMCIFTQPLPATLFGVFTGMCSHVSKKELAFNLVDTFQFMF